MSNEGGSTTNLSLPYPGPDSPNDVPADLQALAEAVDSSVGGFEQVDAPAESLSTSTPTVDFAGDSRLLRLTATGAVDVAWSSVPSSADTARSVTLVVDGADSVSWPAATVFPAGEPPDVEGVTWLVAVAWFGEVAVFVSGSEVA